MAHLLGIDGTNLVHRAWWALARGIKKEIEPDPGDVVTLTVSMIGTHCGRYHQRPGTVSVAFDGPGATQWRKALYAPYKGNRLKERPESLTAALAGIIAPCKEMGCIVECVPGHEADDVLATLAKLAQDTGDVFVVISSDADLLQTIGFGFDSSNPFAAGEVQVDLLTKDGVKHYDRDAFWRDYRFAPHLFADYKALRGDVSDNIPGIRGCGEMAATAFVQYGHIEMLLDHLGREPFVRQGHPSTRKGPDHALTALERRVVENADLLRTFLRLTKLRTDVPLRLIGER